MSLRTSSAFASLALLAACGGVESPLPPGDQADCAVGAGVDFSPVCTLEVVAGTDEVVLHHPDGGFRRLTRDPATGTLVPLDGAEPLVPQAGEGEMLQFAIGDDRYRVPRNLLTPPAR